MARVLAMPKVYAIVKTMCTAMTVAVVMVISPVSRNAILVSMAGMTPIVQKLVPAALTMPVTATVPVM